MGLLVWKAILDGDVVVYHLSGSVATVSDTKVVCRQLADALSEGLTKVVLDCSDLDWAGRTLAGLILACLKQLRVAGGQLRVVEGSLPIGLILGMPPQELHLYASLPQALDSFQARGQERVLT